MQADKLASGSTSSAKAVGHMTLTLLFKVVNLDYIHKNSQLIPGAKCNTI